VFVNGLTRKGLGLDAPGQIRQNRDMAFFASLFLAWSFQAHAAQLTVTVKDKHGNPAADAIVYLVEDKPGSYPAPEATYVMDQVKQEFQPRILPIQAGGRVAFPNKDNIHHHLFSFSEAKKFEVPLHKGKETEPILFEKPGIVKVGCNIHDWMSGLIVVLPTPHFAKTDGKGRAELELPGGEAELEVFHERLRGETSSTRQKVQVTEDAKVEFKLPLKLDNRKKRPATFSNY
jgi:plastocyanin